MDANIQKYQAFVEVADAGSFTKAAETLAYSQSGISHMVSDLERDWGVALFERSRRGVVLTGDGARLLPEARALCESFRALEATVDEVRGLILNNIHIINHSVSSGRIQQKQAADHDGESDHHGNPQALLEQEGGQRHGDDRGRGGQNGAEAYAE